MPNPIKLFARRAGGLVAAVAVGIGAVAAPAPPPELVSQAGHKAAVRSVAVSPQGVIATAGGDLAAIHREPRHFDPTIKLWTKFPGRDGLLLLASLTGNQRAVQQITFSPDGQILASAGADASVRLWAVSNAQSLAVFTNHHQLAVTAVCFNDDGSRLASAGLDGRIFWFDSQARTPRLLRSWTNSAGISSMAFLNDRLVIGTVTGDVLRWVPEQPHHPVVLGSQTGPVSAIVADPANDRVALVAGSAVSLFSGKNLDQVKNPVSFAHAIYALARAGDKLVIGGADGRLRVLALPDLRVLAETPAHADMITSVAVAPDGKSLVSGSLEGLHPVKIWALLPHLALLDALPAVQTRLSTEGFSLAANNPFLAFAGGHDFRVKLFDLNAGSLLREFGENSGAPHLDEVIRVALTSDNRYLASSGRDGLRIYDVQKPNITWSFTLPNWGIGLAFGGPQDQYLAVACGDWASLPNTSGAIPRQIHLFRRTLDPAGNADFRRLAPTENLLYHARALLFAGPEKATLLAGCYNGEIRRWQVSADGNLSRLPSLPDSGMTNVSALVLTPDQHYLVAGGKGDDAGAVAVYDLPVLRRVALRPHAHGDTVRLAGSPLDPDLFYTASAGWSGSVKRWSITNFLQLNGSYSAPTLYNLPASEKADSLAADQRGNVFLSTREAGNVDFKWLCLASNLPGQVALEWHSVPNGEWVAYSPITHGFAEQSPGVANRSFAFRFHGNLRETYPLSFYAQYLTPVLPLADPAPQKPAQLQPPTEKALHEADPVYREKAEKDARLRNWVVAIVISCLVGIILVLIIRHKSNLAKQECARADAEQKQAASERARAEAMAKLADMETQKNKELVILAEDISAAHERNKFFFLQTVHAVMKAIEPLADFHKQTANQDPEILKALETLESLCTRVVDLVKYKHFSPVIEVKSISKTLSSIKTLYDHKCQSCAISLDYTSPDSDVYARADFCFLIVAIWNILDNAIKAIAREGLPEGNIKISLAYSPDPAQVTIAIEDTGPGYHANQDGGLKTSLKQHFDLMGLGIGIAGVEYLLSAFEARFRIESPLVNNRGTRFVLFWKP